MSRRSKVRGHSPGIVISSCLIHTEELALLKPAQHALFRDKIHSQIHFRLLRQNTGRTFSAPLQPHCRQARSPSPETTRMSVDRNLGSCPHQLCDPWGICLLVSGFSFCLRGRARKWSSLFLLPGTVNVRQKVFTVALRTTSTH